MAKAFPLMSIDPEDTLASNAPLMLHTRLAEMYRFARYVHDSERVEDLHNMRIAAKRLRYTMEVFAPCFPGPTFDGLYENVKKIQEQIGDIHDCDVRVPMLSSHIASDGRHHPEIRIGIEKAVAAEQAKRRRLYGRFIRSWTKLDTEGFRGKFLEMFVVSRDKTD
jgi:CHAD domain-containing protein